MTLFRKTNFHGYYDVRDIPVVKEQKSPERSRRSIDQEIALIEKRIHELMQERTWAKSDALKADCSAKILQLEVDKRTLKSEFDNAGRSGDLKVVDKANSL